jgi:hypothetical protein
MKRKIILFVMMFVSLAVLASCETSGVDSVQSLYVEDQTFNMNTTWKLADITADVRYTSGSKEQIKLDDSRITLSTTPDFTKAGTYLVKATFKEAQTTFKVYVISTTDKYSLTITLVGNGSFTGNGSYAKGDMVELSATPSEGYEFVSWNKGQVAVSTKPVWSFSMPDNNLQLSAVFRLIPTTALTVIDRMLYAFQNSLPQPSEDSIGIRFSEQVTLNKVTETSTVQYTGSMNGIIDLTGCETAIQLKLWTEEHVKTDTTLANPDVYVTYQDGVDSGTMFVQAGEFNHSESIPSLGKSVDLSKLKNTHETGLSLKDLVLNDSLEADQKKMVEQVLDSVLGDNPSTEIFVHPTSNDSDCSYSVNVNEFIKFAVSLSQTNSSSIKDEDAKKVLDWFVQNQSSLPDMTLVHTMNLTTSNSKEVPTTQNITVTVGSTYETTLSDGKKLTLEKGTYSMDLARNSCEYVSSLSIEK